MKKNKAYFEPLQNLIFGKSVERFEVRLLMITTFSISVILAVSTTFDIILGLKPSIAIVSAAGTLIYFSLYLFERLISRNRFIFLITSVITLVFIDGLWFVNYGSNGPITPLFIVFYAFLILVFDRRYYLTISALLFLNLFGLYFIELLYPEQIGFYPDLNTRIDDNYIGMLFNLLVIFPFISAIKKNYIQEYERAKMSDQLKSAFLANMSHEIRTPLNAIVGFSSLMSDPDIPAEDKKSFDREISQNSDYLVRLIDDIIDVSRIESNQLTFKIQEVDVVSMVRQITGSFQLAILPGKNVKIIENLNISELKIRVDKARLEQILHNLLSNAVKFTECGNIEVGCQTGKEFVTFSVKDTGIGIPPENQTIIFERFTKIDCNKHLFQRGTGIGLFLSKKLVEMFGGKIWVESVPGKGSNFYFTIPV